MSKATSLGKNLKIKGRLPKLDEGFNGLQDAAGDVLADQSRSYIVVLEVRCDEVVLKDYGDLTEGKLQITQVEVVLDNGQEQLLRQLLRQRLEERTGGTPLFE